MAEGTLYEGKKAIEFLTTVFEDIDPDTRFLVALSGLRGKKESTTVHRNVSIAGFSEERRKTNGKIDKLTGRTGSVFLYGEDHPDYFLILKHDRKTLIFPLENASAQRVGFADSIIRITSDDWTKAAAVEITMKNVYADSDALKYFSRTVVEKVNDGSYAARLGKWVSKKVFDRDLDKDIAEKMAIEEAVRHPEEENLRTMIIGCDIQHIGFTQGDTSKEIPHSLKARQAYNSTTIQFRDIVVEADTAGKEIGAKNSVSTYVFLIGTALNAPANLIIVRHRPNAIRQV